MKSKISNIKNNLFVLLSKILLTYFHPAISIISKCVNINIFLFQNEIKILQNTPSIKQRG